MRILSAPRSSQRSLFGLALVASLLITVAGQHHHARRLRGSQCNQDILDTSFVTQCGPGICEPLLEPEVGGKRVSEWPSSRDQVVHIASSRDTDRFKVSTYKSLDTDEHYYEESHVNGSIFVETNTKYQRILGFGTTLTDAACKNVDDLPAEARNKLLHDYFSPSEGIGLNLIKVPIGSTKYSYTNYVLDQPDSHQLELSPYDIDQRIPIIKDALKSAGKLKNRVKVLASAATAPAEFKRNNKMVHGGYLRSDKFSDYANYLLAFMSAYKRHEISIWALILSESPVTIARSGDNNDALDFSSMAMKPSDTIRLIRAIKEIRSHRLDLDKFRMLLLGDSRAHIPVWADVILKQPSVASDVAGIAYTSDSSSDQFAPYDNLEYITRRYPNKYLLTSQASNNAPVKLGNWQYAENYATEMVKNLEYGSVGWIDFNMALNLEGGPTINDRFKSDASVMIDPKRGFFYRSPMFYAIGHLSRYVKPGSVRVRSSSLSSAHMYAHQSIAFVTPDNFLVVFVSNNNIGPMPINIGIGRRTRVSTMLDTKSFNTFVFWL